MQGLTEGTRLANRYVLLRRIGEGGMSEVWAARDERADCVVALKTLKKTLASQDAYRTLFHKEWRIGSRLMHAHIARVFEYHDEDDGPFFAMQFIDGPDIGVLANESLDNALRPIGLLADALRYAHGKGFVHRDIKASNVLLDQSGSPYLLDFGVAAANSGGSPINASPDQVAGAEPVPADDVYALGVLLHEVLSGQPASAGSQAPRTRPDGEAVPGAVRQLLESMLAIDAGQRPSAEAVARSLAAAGFVGGPARLPAGLRKTTAANDVVEPRSRSIEPQRRPSPISHSAPEVSAETPGIAANTVYLGLGAMLLLFVVVIFVLPKAVDTPGETAVPGGDDGQASVADPVADAAADPDAERDLRPAIPAAGADEEGAGFSENLEPGAAGGLSVKLATDEALGDLLSRLERLRYRGIDRWGGQPFLDALDVYAQGDEAYLNKNYTTAGDRYRRATALLEPFFDRIDVEFEKSLAAAEAAFERRDVAEAIRLYDLSVAITPGNPSAERGLSRAQNLEAVLDLMSQGRQYRAELELDAAKLAFEKAFSLDPEWQPAEVALAEIAQQIKELSFQMRMTEGLEALAASDFDSARAAFNAARKINPESREPGDGLLQVDQEIRLYRIGRMENEAAVQESGEQWEAAVGTYEALLEVDGDLQFAKEGLARAKGRASVHRQLQAYINDPDSLNDTATMQRATQMLLSVSRMDPLGPRLVDEKDELSRLLKIAATPLTVRFESDNQTQVSIYRVGRLGSFAARDLELRPGKYVATGMRPGFRDVRLEFRVSAEKELQAIIVKCEEAI
jgi:tetratricopeptide (TPR) repeat protein